LLGTAAALRGSSSSCRSGGSSGRPGCWRCIHSWLSCPMRLRHSRTCLTASGCGNICATHVLPSTFSVKAQIGLDVCILEAKQYACLEEPKGALHDHQCCSSALTAV
jgi:hypothetical protein